MKQYDAIIIGFGKGGKLLAAELAERNWKVAIVERSPQMYGGTCVNVGCIPTKTLIHESEYAEKRYYEVTSAADGACASSLPSCCCKSLTCCC